MTETNKFIVKEGYALFKKELSWKELRAKINYDSKYTGKYKSRNIYKLINK